MCLMGHILRPWAAVAVFDFIVMIWKATEININLKHTVDYLSCRYLGSTYIEMGILGNTCRTRSQFNH